MLSNGSLPFFPSTNLLNHRFRNMEFLKYLGDPTCSFPMKSAIKWSLNASERQIRRRWTKPWMESLGGSWPARGRHVAWRFGGNIFQESQDIGVKEKVCYHPIFLDTNFSSFFHEYPWKLKVASLPIWECSLPGGICWLVWPILTEHGSSLLCHDTIHRDHLQVHVVMKRGTHPICLFKYMKFLFIVIFLNKPT